MLRSVRIALAVLVVAAGLWAPARARAQWAAATTIASDAESQTTPAVATSAAGTVVAWVSHRGVTARVAAPGGAFAAPVRVVRLAQASGASDVRVATDDRGDVVVAWLSQREGRDVDDEGFCCDYWSAAVRPAGALRFSAPTRLSSIRHNATATALGFDARGRPVAAWDQPAAVHAALIGLDGRVLRRHRLARTPGAALVGLDTTGSEPRALVVVGDSAALDSVPFWSRAPSRRRRLLRGNLAGDVETAVDAAGVRAVAWDDNDTSVRAAVRRSRGGRLGHARLLLRDGRRPGFFAGLGADAAGDVLLALVDDPVGLHDRSSLRVAWARPGGRWTAAHRVRGVPPPAPGEPAVALAPGGRGAVAWLSTRHCHVEVAAYAGAARLATAGFAVRRPGSLCDGDADERPLAIGVDRTGLATVAWRDGGRIRAARGRL